MPPALRDLYTWEGKGYGVLNDADGQVLYYRRDVLTDAKWQAAFKERHGYDLPVPPATWQQVQDIAGFFDGENWDAGDGQADSGMVLHLKQGEQGHYHFQSLAASFAVTPGPQVDRHHKVFFFDPEDMRPLINSPGHVAALELLQALNETGPVEQIGWRLPQAWEYFLRGKAVMTFSWGDLGSLCQDESRSERQGQVRYRDPARLAASMGPCGQAWIESPTPQPVGNTTGGSWHGVVTRQSANQEAAYSFLALMAIPPVSAWNGRTGWTGVNPGFAYQMLPPAGHRSAGRLYQGRLGPGRRRGLSRRLRPQLQRTHHAALSAPARHRRVFLGPRHRARRRHGRPQDAHRRRSTTRPRPGTRSPTGWAASSSSRPTASAIGYRPAGSG